MTTSSHEKRIQVSLRPLGQGERVFTLSLEQEIVALQPGTTWSHVDRYKWVTRGLIEEPQMLHVLPDGSVEINSEKINITDPSAATKLEHQINKRHAAEGGHPSSATAAIGGQPAAAARPDARRFRVKLDAFGHLMIEWGHGLDRDGTGLRGLGSLIANGLIRKPEHYRVDPMQRSIEIDGVKYECNEAGAKQLEAALNTRYAPHSDGHSAPAIEIKENLAASTGFDIHFRTSHAGVTHDIKGHLSQELLDQLQDPARSELVQPGIHLFLSPPNLLIRRRRPDLGEEKIPELPDVSLHRLTAAQLQQIFNHPLVRRTDSNTTTAQLLTGGAPPTMLGELRIVRHREEKRFLWLECISTGGETQGTKALTHHNIAELQHSGCFQTNLEVGLSLDHRRLTIHDRHTQRDDTIILDPIHSPDETLGEASQMLSRALKYAAFGTDVPSTPAGIPRQPPPSTPLVALSTAPPDSLLPQANEAPPSVSDTLPRSAEPLLTLDQTVVALFQETDALRINQEVFRCLSLHLGIAPQEAHLSLPFVFENRRFEILNFERQDITSPMELRGTDFYGFYLSHVSEKKILLVYACNGMHIEWGPDKCVLQPTIRSEPEEYNGSVLLGLAQDPKSEFVFIVRPDFKKWIAPREMPYTDENLQFRVVAEIAAESDNFSLIWPQRPAPLG